MTDLTPAFKEAANRSQEWNGSMAEEALRICEANVAGSRSEWEEGEGWGMVTKPNEIVSCISAAVPVAMINEKYINSLVKLLSKYHLTVIPFSDFDLRKYSIDPAILEASFDVTIAPSAATFGKTSDKLRDFENVSLHDIWFHTV